jgi:hypothetical protein
MRQFSTWGPSLGKLLPKFGNFFNFYTSYTF